jgi:hypothetical protein
VDPAWQLDREEEEAVGDFQRQVEVFVETLELKTWVMVCSERMVA